jgi:phage FluMu gp28-like protein
MISEKLIKKLQESYHYELDVYLVSDELWQEYRKSINLGYQPVDEIIIHRKWYQFWKPKFRIEKGFNNLLFRGVPVVNKDYKH